MTDADGDSVNWLWIWMRVFTSTNSRWMVGQTKNSSQMVTLARQPLMYNRTFEVFESTGRGCSLNACTACLPDCPAFPPFDEAECHDANGSLTLNTLDDTLVYEVDGIAIENGMIELMAGTPVDRDMDVRRTRCLKLEHLPPSALMRQLALAIATVTTKPTQVTEERLSWVRMSSFSRMMTAIELDSLAAGVYTITVTDSVMTTFEMTIQIFGCTEPGACNYDPAATDSSGCIVGPGPAAGFLAMDALCFDGAGSVMLDSLTASDTTNVFMVGDSLLGVEALTLLPCDYSIARLVGGCTATPRSSSLLRTP